jgi:hypothetical protein
MYIYMKEVKIVLMIGIMVSASGSVDEGGEDVI